MVSIVIFIGSAGDLKPNTKQQMSAKAFCYRHNLKKEEDSLASSPSILNDNKKH